MPGAGQHPAAMQRMCLRTIIENGSPDRLTGALAAMAQLHKPIIVNGVRTMREVAGLPLWTGMPVTLAAGGYHLMLTRLKHRLKDGDAFPRTPTFEHASPITRRAEGAAARASMPVEGAGHAHAGNQAMIRLRD